MREIGRRQVLSRFGGVTVAGLAAVRLGSAGQGSIIGADAGSASWRVPGTLLWWRQAGGSAAGQTPVVVAGYGLAYEAGNIENDGDASTYAVNAATGALAWRTPRDAGGPLAYAAGPGAVFGLQLSGSTTHVIALTAAAGTPLWVREAGRLLDNAGAGWLAYASKMVYIAAVTGQWNSSVRALDAHDGRQVWAAAFPSYTQQPVIADGTVYASTKTGVVALSGSSGARIWESGDLGEASGTLVTTDGIICGNIVDGAYGLDAATGRPLWFADAGSTTAADSGILFCTAFSSGLLVHALHAASGRPAWTRIFSWNAEVLAAADGVVYIGGADNGELLAVSAATGQNRWSYRLSAPVSSVSVAGGVVFAVDNNGRVYALRA
jgi:outer membrane protein assembly factor BamB